MKNNIRISQCKNGFIVESQFESHKVSDVSEILVFQSMSELIEFIENNFTHRTLHLQSDASRV